MEFEWDGDKAESNERKHGVPFTFATRVFLDAFRIIRPDKRHDYGEARYIVLGMIEGRVYVVAYTQRNHLTRLISARKGNDREKNFYHDAIST